MELFVKSYYQNSLRYSARSLLCHAFSLQPHFQPTNGCHMNEVKTKAKLHAVFSAVIAHFHKTSGEKKELKLLYNLTKFGIST